MNRKEIHQHAINTMQRVYNSQGDDNWLCNMYMIYLNKYCTADDMFNHIYDSGCFGDIEPFEKMVMSDVFMGLLNSVRTIGMLSPDKSYVEVTECILSIQNK